MWEERFTKAGGANELRFDEGDAARGRAIAGYASVFDAPSADLGGFTEIIKPGAFTKTLTEGDQKALWNHNSDIVLGSTRSGSLRLRQDEHGLAFELDLPADGFEREAGMLRRGDVDGVSFGFRVIREEFHERTGPEGFEMLREIQEVELREISPTAFPAYPQTEVLMRCAHRAASELQCPDAFSRVIASSGLTADEVRAINLGAVPAKPMPTGGLSKMDAETRYRRLTAPR